VRQTRARHRHELRNLTYVTLDQANGGIIRNLTHDGIAVQVVAAVRPRQQFRVRFDLRYPRLRVEARGEVVWATFSGQCGIRFLDMPPRMVRQIDEWIFGNLLERATLHTEDAGPMFAGPGPEEDDGLLISAAARNVIELPVHPEARQGSDEGAVRNADEAMELDWLSQPLSGRSLAWTVNALIVIAGILLFALVFLSITREAPKWPFEMAGGAATFVAAFYWGFFKAFGGASFGARLARLVEMGGDQEEESGVRFR